MGTINDVVVVGGGPAGCAAAIGLARSGRSVVLLERERAPHAKVCGEFLSVEACAEARALGVDPITRGASRIDRVRVSWGRASVETALPFEAASLSRSRFDEALLRAALDVGVDVRRGVRAVSIDRTVVRARENGHDRMFRAAAVVLASGKSEVAGFHRNGAHFPEALGFKMHLVLDRHDYEELGSVVNLALFAGGYAGMQRIEDGIVAFALVVRRDAYARLGSWTALVRAIAATNSRMQRRLDGATELWQKPLAVSGVPYGFLFRDTVESGTYRIGDQLAVIPSFTGDGMAIALVTGSCVARAIAAGDAPQIFHAAMRERLARPMRVSGMLSRAIASPIGRAAVMWPAAVVPRIFSLVATQTRISR